MTARTNLESVWKGEIPAKVPHFELVFQLPEEAFDLSWPTSEEVQQATAPEREVLRERYFEIWERIHERYGWAAAAMDDRLFPAEDPSLLAEGRERLGNDMMIYVFNGEGTYWMPTGSEMMAFTEMLYERPDDAHALARKKRDDSIALAQGQVDQGAEFICINSDYAYNQGPFISPTLFAEFVTPYLTEIVAAIHDMNVPALLHSDGDLRQVLDQLVSTGLDGYQSIDPQGNMDIAEVKRDHGDRLVLMGNVQTSLLQDVDEEKIRGSVRYSMENGKPGGRYIFSTSNCIFKGMPLESYHIMLDEYARHA
jgi:uroporphyrinogen decarboxylase